LIVVLAVAGGVGGATLVGGCEQHPREPPAPSVARPQPQPQLPPPTPRQVEETRDLGRTFARVAAQIGPSVVRISVTRPMVRRPAPVPEQLPLQQGTGSGVVIDTQGHIVTNNHVVEGATEVKVAFVDGAEVDGKVIGTDPRGDLAVVKVSGVALTPARIGDSDALAVGNWVIAIGNPFGLDHTVTVGVLSARNRSGFTSGNYEDFLQTDASINPGNSGGPLINLDGEVIGINTAIAGIGTGIGFAVPSTMVRPIAEQLIATGAVRRPYIGIRTQDLTPELRDAFGKGAPAKGALVAQIEEGSPAARAGVRPGDVVTSIDGEEVDRSSTMQRLVVQKQIGQELELGVWRDGERREISVTAAELPAARTAAGADDDKPDIQGGLGFALQTMTPELARRLRLAPDTQGAVVTVLRRGGPAARAGIHVGDVIVEIDREPIGSADAAADALRASRPGSRLLRILRGDAALFITVEPT
jgi:serine protease Do